MERGRKRERGREREGEREREREKERACMCVFLEIVTLIASRRKDFQNLLVISFVAEFPPKMRCIKTPALVRFLLTVLSHVESRALMCPFKPSHLSAWSQLSCHPTHTNL